MDVYIHIWNFEEERVREKKRCHLRMLKMPLTGSREPKSMKIRRGPDDVDVAGKGSVSMQERIVVFIFSAIMLAICIVFLVVGIVYLTGLFYPYSFTRFSTTLVAGLFIAFGSVIILTVIANVFLVFIGQDRFVGLTTIISALLLIVLFAIGNIIDKLK